MNVCENFRFQLICAANVPDADVAVGVVVWHSHSVDLNFQALAVSFVVHT